MFGSSLYRVTLSRSVAWRDSLHLFCSTTSSISRRRFSVYSPSIGPLPLSCHVGIGLHFHAFQMQVVHLIPGQLPCINLVVCLWQALEPSHSLLCNRDDGPPFGGVLNALPQPGCRERKRGKRGLCTSPPLLR
jgi:hypothetical protein